MNWNDAVTGLVEIVAFVGPAYLYHHAKIRAIIKVIGAIADAASGDPSNPEK